MPRQLVEVVGRDGHVIHTYTVQLDHEECVEAEYEEFALVLAEKSGKIEEAEYVHLRARCVK